MKTIYEVPLALEAQGMCSVVLKMLGMEDRTPDLVSWEGLVNKIKNPEKSVKVAIAGKYTKLSDAYISVRTECRICGCFFC